MKRTLILLVAMMTAGALPAIAADGKALYEKNCKKCHGADGKGETRMGKQYGAKDYTSAKVQDALKDEDAIKAVKKGYTNKEGKEVMKPSEDLSDSDIKAVIAYLRTFKK
jgi:cytochrome c553